MQLSGLRENLEHVSTGKEKIAVEIVAGLLLIILMNYLIITNIVNIILLGHSHFDFRQDAIRSNLS